MKANWKTWSPFQSPEVREICAHMTDREKGEVSHRGAFYGFWVAATFAGPLSFAIVEHNLFSIVIAAVLVSIHLACIPIWQEMPAALFVFNGMGA